MYYCRHRMLQMVKEKQQISSKEQGLGDLSKELILFNDNKNTFEYVIQTLVDVCEHEQHQAEQCAYIAHYRGKCVVKSGVFGELKPKLDEMTRRGLTVSID
jgi:ATP-dependent Clp protease adaptor protein ClpS